MERRECFCKRKTTVCADVGGDTSKIICSLVLSSRVQKLGSRVVRSDHQILKISVHH